MDFVIISGLSGAGKSSIAAYLEDLNFYCVDNLPISLIPNFAALCMAGGSVNYDRVALVTDIRGGQVFDGLFQVLDELTAMSCDYTILFVEADDETIIKRYKETRHTHPLARTGSTLALAVPRERFALAAVRQRATYILNTTALTHAQLRSEVLHLFGNDTPDSVLSVSVLSFGFKYGLPIEADLVFDVRFLPNPYYIPSMRDLTGLDEEVRTFLYSYQQTHDFLRHLQRLLGFLLPQYVQEGKVNLTIAVGCTGGRHRSVEIARTVAEFVRQKGYRALATHRDIDNAAP
jgi:UPF0042 nucleotide-binding protein